MSCERRVPSVKAAWEQVIFVECNDMNKAADDRQLSLELIPDYSDLAERFAQACADALLAAEELKLTGEKLRRAVATYSGVEVDDWTIDDLIRYADGVVASPPETERH